MVSELRRIKLPSAKPVVYCVPKLFIHGSSDEVIPVEMGKQLYAMSAEPKTLLIVPDGRHRDTVVKAGDEWIKAMRRLVGLES